MDSCLELSREGRVLRITLNRPEHKNSLDGELCASLIDVVEAAWVDDGVGAILLDAKGQIFSSGIDFEEAVNNPMQHAEVDHARLFSLGLRSPKPIVAAVNGPALAEGVALIANAHIAVAAHGCSFGLTQIRAGMFPFVSFDCIAKAIGERRALELSLTGRIFQLPEAIQWGLIAEATPAFELDDRVTAIAGHLSEWSEAAVSAALRFFRERSGKTLAEISSMASAAHDGLLAGGEVGEGVAALKEKRRPVWRRSQPPSLLEST
jgi:enoyl-CoA hydratase/carnithine racemase